NDPRDEAEDLLPALRGLFPPRFGLEVSETTLRDLATYLVGITRGAREPVRWFEARLRNLAQAQATLWEILYRGLPDIVATRQAALLGGDTEARGASPSDPAFFLPPPSFRRGRGWQRGFERLEESLLERVRQEVGTAGDHPGVEAVVTRLVSTWRHWEAD